MHAGLFIGLKKWNMNQNTYYCSNKQIIYSEILFVEFECSSQIQIFFLNASRCYISKSYKDIYLMLLSPLISYFHLNVLLTILKELEITKKSEYSG